MFFNNDESLHQMMDTNTIDGCPKCGSNNHEPIIPENLDKKQFKIDNLTRFCNNCGYQWHKK